MITTMQKARGISWPRFIKWLHANGVGREIIQTAADIKNRVWISRSEWEAIKPWIEKYCSSRGEDGPCERRQRW